MRFLRRFSSVAAVVAVTMCVAGVVRPQAQAGPKTASALLDAARLAAHEEEKNILVEFGASWCGWCHRFAAFVQSPDVGPLMARHYVMVKFTVQERPEKRALNTLGAQSLMDEWGGGRSGLPFYVFLNAKGEKIAGSNAMSSGANIGYPATPVEIQAFVRLLEQTAPRMSADERARIAQYLKGHAGK